MGAETSRTVPITSLLFPHRRCGHAVGHLHCALMPARPLPKRESVTHATPKRQAASETLSPSGLRTSARETGQGVRGAWSWLYLGACGNSVWRSTTALLFESLAQLVDRNTTGRIDLQRPGRWHHLLAQPGLDGSGLRRVRLSARKRDADLSFAWHWLAPVSRMESNPTPGCENRKLSDPRPPLACSTPAP